MFAPLSCRERPAADPRSRWRIVEERTRAKAAAWRDDYNRNRPHSSLGDLTPLEYARKIRTGLSFCAA
jgi:transposase InsO family protein